MQARLTPFIGFSVWLAIILYLSFGRLESLPQNTFFNQLYLDKVVHFVMYAILEALFLFGFFKSAGNRSVSILITIITLLFCVTLGASVEFLQPILTTYRKFEWLDMVANSSGAFGGLYFFNRYWKKRLLERDRNKVAA